MSGVVAVIDYGMGNLHSVASALAHAGADEVLVTHDADVIRQADRVVFPGVGAIRDCMAEIRRLKCDQLLVDALTAQHKPVLAICVGMQALLTHSAENDGVPCLDIIPGEVRYFGNPLVDAQGQRLKVPHMGWNEVQQHNWQQPLYWGNIDGEWFEYTLNGLQPLDESVPVSHLSYYEAQAYAAWAGKRLPTEAEWESAAQQQSVAGNLLYTNRLQPQAASNAAGAIGQLFGDCWEWTQSAYLPYPGYQPMSGAIGEYNGKFMSGQMVLRGGSCFSQAFHIRSSYRNFFYPRDRWQCSGIRLAADI